MSPLDTNLNPASEWKPVSAIGPVTGTKVFPGTLIAVTINVADFDHYEKQGKIVRLPNGSEELTANLSVTNATFQNGSTTATLTLKRVSADIFAENQIVRVKIPDPWMGDVTVTATLIDPGQDPIDPKHGETDIAGMRATKNYTFEGKLSDTDLTLTTTWMRVSANAAYPTTVNAISGKYQPSNPNVLPKDMIPISAEYATRNMNIVYRYGPRPPQAGTALYDGIPVQESFGKVSTNYSGRDESAINPKVLQKLKLKLPGPGVTFDEYLNAWITPFGYSTFTIGTVEQDVGGVKSQQVDCTRDMYSITIPEKMADEFLRVFPVGGDEIKVSAVQTYKCNGKDLTGDVPANVISRCIFFDVPQGTAIKKRQQVIPK